MREDPYKCLRIGELVKTADSILLELERKSMENIKTAKKPIIEFSLRLKKTSKQRCLSCVLYFDQKENENDGHTVMNIVDLEINV